MAAGKGMLLGTAAALLFGLPVLASALRVPPARVLRRDVEPLPPARIVRFLVGAAVVLGVFALAAAQARSVVLGAWFTGGLLVAAGVLALAALATTRGLGLLPRARLPVWARHGLASASRPGAATFGSIVALGLGVLVVLAMALAERNLSKKLLAGLPKDAPTAFFLDVQPDQVEGLRALLVREGATGIESVPVVSARLTAIDGKKTDRRPGSGGRREGGEERRWALSREQRLTSLEKLPADNRIVEGALWKEAGPEVSVEEDFARRRLGVGLGAVLTFDVQGFPFDLKVTSLRKVDWRTFGINFFLVVKPGVLDGAPQTRLAVARLPASAEERVQGLAAREFPNVTMIRTREVMEKVGAILGKAGLAVRLLGLFTVLSGVVLLGGAVSASSARRGREAALLKTLGMTRAAVAGLFAAEYALVGLVAGVIGAAGGALLARGVVVRLFDLGWEAEPLLVLATPAAAVLLAVLAGLAASAGALSRRPLETLRSE
jgi:putative ABC transport system permease protein